ncbi:MAG: hypothetical protein A3G32_01925 [Deltaproteobacteria bacterium RIFCSPLOWO2_12_FULL_40_28]|nr:MAG: hypothetical protein A3C45_06670 [Deltaproteobacteria bacterium RIFCSPHIGHO2_02_FULL_40_28]OGQ18888.1 MAG: hypothetical protein A3E27_09305 [Deltaproteobacteria bacterium RIFCSPHIGHO2_12_FULL_40_32]OGQ40133.1 MAG: hypothetical protein A3I69_01835 [Deltaproteobacteria bacterium RIFCSPLOWO2_02_FULL_40_36]OGQ53316.1 MAG: hypothetical protein A3G32_01925 [Deltaproteobacteria bacterium RIFCSPLOWO2_12_FULL_40_28]
MVTSIIHGDLARFRNCGLLDGLTEGTDFTITPTAFQEFKVDLLNDHATRFMSEQLENEKIIPGVVIDADNNPSNYENQVFIPQTRLAAVRQLSRQNKAVAQILSPGQRAFLSGVGMLDRNGFLKDPSNPDAIQTHQVYYADRDGNLDTIQDSFYFSKADAEGAAGQIFASVNIPRMAETYKLSILLINDATGNITAQAVTLDNLGLYTVPAGQHIPGTPAEEAAVKAFITSQTGAYGSYQLEDFKRRFIDIKTSVMGANGQPVEEAVPFNATILAIPKIEDACSSLADSAKGYYTLDFAFNPHEINEVNDLFAIYNINPMAYDGCVQEMDTTGAKTLRFKIDPNTLPAMLKGIRDAIFMLRSDPPQALPANADPMLAAAYEVLNDMDPSRRRELYFKFQKYAEEQGVDSLTPTELQAHGLSMGASEVMQLIGALSLSHVVGAIVLTMILRTAIGAGLEAAKEEAVKKARRAQLAKMSLDDFVKQWGEDPFKDVETRIPLEGRENEVRQTFMIWERTDGKSFAAFVGEGGSGKTVMVKEIARHMWLRRRIMELERDLREQGSLGLNQRLTQTQVEARGYIWSLCPESLAYNSYISVQIATLIRDAKYVGEPEERAMRLVDLLEAERTRSNIVRVNFEEIGDAASVSSMRDKSPQRKVVDQLKPYIGDGRVTGSCTMTNADYNKIATDEADAGQLSRRLEPIRLGRLGMPQLINAARRAIDGTSDSAVRTARVQPVFPDARPWWVRKVDWNVRSGTLYPLRHPIDWTVGTYRWTIDTGTTFYTAGRTIWRARPRWLGNPPAPVSNLGAPSWVPTSAIRNLTVVSPSNAVLEGIVRSSSALPGSPIDRVTTVAKSVVSYIHYLYEMQELPRDWYTEAADGRITVVVTDGIARTILNNLQSDAIAYDLIGEIEAHHTVLHNEGFIEEDLRRNYRAYDLQPGETRAERVARLRRIRGSLQALVQRARSVGSTSANALGMPVEEGRWDQVITQAEVVRQTYDRMGRELPRPPAADAAGRPAAPASGMAAPEAPRPAGVVRSAPTLGGRSTLGSGLGKTLGGGLRSSVPAATAVPPPAPVSTFVPTPMEAMIFDTVRTAEVYQALNTVDPVLANYFRDDLSEGRATSSIAQLLERMDEGVAREVEARMSSYNLTSEQALFDMICGQAQAEEAVTVQPADYARLVDGFERGVRASRVAVIERATVTAEHARRVEEEARRRRSGSEAMRDAARHARL